MPTPPNAGTEKDAPPGQSKDDPGSVLYAGSNVPLVDGKAPLVMSRNLPASGAIGISDIHNEFGRGHDLNAYRGVPWYTEAGGSGHFSSGQISMAEFFGKRSSPPPVQVYTHTIKGGVGTYSYVTENVDFGTAISNRYVVVGAWSSDNDAPTPTTATVGGQPTTRVTVRTGSGAYALFITNSPFTAGGVQTVRFNLSANSNNRILIVWSLVGNINPTPIEAKPLNSFGSNTIYIRPGGVVLAVHGVHNSGATISVGGLNKIAGDPYGSHTYACSYLNCYAEGHHAISQSPTGGAAIASWGQY